MLGIGMIGEAHIENRGSTLSIKTKRDSSVFAMSEFAADASRKQLASTSASRILQGIPVIRIVFACMLAAGTGLTKCRGPGSTKFCISFSMLNKTQEVPSHAVNKCAMYRTWEIPGMVINLN